MLMLLSMERATEKWRQQIGHEFDRGSVSKVVADLRNLLGILNTIKLPPNAA